MQSAGFKSVYTPSICLECVLLVFDEDQLKVLLVNWSKTKSWGLPVGFLRKTETLEQAVKRVYRVTLSLLDVGFKQFKVFSEPERQSANPEIIKTIKGIVSERFNPIDADEWFAQRFISMGFLTTARMRDVNPKLSIFFDEYRWHSANELPTLAFDHGSIVYDAIDYLKNNINDIKLISHLLPPKFTMGELRKFYEVILSTKLDRGNFQRKILSENILIRHEKLMTGASNRAPYLYSFKI